ncbi:hypothetical protein ABFG93_06305 [Pseudalkalibacillus hwajinpoensis]|uniref:hypothetical protein n=1 Tax=Guptibacillus hwajinpoensis TaxID=208199 RepID=UPI00325A5303
MRKQTNLVQRLITREHNSLFELYDAYIFHIRKIVSTSKASPDEEERIISELFHTIWTTPLILSNEKYLSVAITKLGITIMINSSRNVVI